MQVRFEGVADALPEFRALVEELRRSAPPGVRDVVAAYDSVTLHFDPMARPGFEEWLADVVARVVRKPVASTTAVRREEVPADPYVHLRVCYGGEHGPDLVAAASHCGLAPADLIERHAAGDYVVRAIGFTPGFAYLGGLPTELAIPRRATPRLIVPAGSVAIGGAQTGIYPIDSPGGWNVIGRTAAVLFDPRREPAALLAIGDRVQFEPVGARAFARRVRTLVAARPKNGAAPTIEVVEPGLQTTVQDLGRRGFEAQGVTPGGAADRGALRLANRLVGNEDAAAGLEFALLGPLLRVLRFTRIALTGAVASTPWGRPRDVAPGELLDLRKLSRGARGYLALAGGIDVPSVLGGCGTDLRAGFGGFEGRALQAGDRLQAAGGAHRPDRPCIGAAAPCSVPNWCVDSAHLVDRRLRAPLRVMRGPEADWFDAATWATFLARAYVVTSRSDRMGVRLAGPPLLLRQPRELLSEGVATGTVQVPPDGQPIVLLADRQTIGGYPKVANVISADLDALAQLGPGDTVRFEGVDLEAATAATHAAARAWARLDAALRLRGIG
ncbi:MAG: 5-oxoprolinase subunit PxpB [Planctomycetes bacterium]|nr:5-oxoprolinase subunit PxpB [Planctomycetota bacterium]